LEFTPFGLLSVCLEHMSIHFFDGSLENWTRAILFSEKLVPSSVLFRGGLGLSLRRWAVRCVRSAVAHIDLFLYLGVVVYGPSR